MSCVYVIEGGGLHKTGSTMHPPHKRLAALKTASPVALRLVVEIQTPSCRLLESCLHHRFSAKRKRGEWFKLTPLDLLWIDTLHEEKAQRQALEESAPLDAALIQPTEYDGDLVLSPSQVATNAGISKQAVSIALDDGRLTVVEVIGRRAVKQDDKYEAFLVSTRNRKNGQSKGSKKR